METNIKIEGTYKVIAGSTEWLKQQIENGKFRFGSTKDKEPCVIWDFYEKKGEEIVKTKSIIVVFIDAEQADSEGWRNYTGNCKLIHTDGNSYLCPTLFNYLTQNAKEYCNHLIKMLANKLISKVANDKQVLKITVAVE